MKLRCAIAVLVWLTALAVCFAQGDKPWEKQGTKAGQEITGPDGGKMVWVPPGEFDMGSNDGFDDEKPVHHVRITKGFWLGKCTVTNAQYQRYCQDAAMQFPKESDQGTNYPVVGVGWDDLQAYCKHYGLALPTEAQWEWAARGPQGRTYPWGNDWDPKKCCWAGNQGPRGKAFPVGSLPQGASWCGALDMVGNVYQWCADWFDSNYYTVSPEADPPGAARGETLAFGLLSRASRGGSWGGTVLRAYRCACRNGVPPVCQYNFGFRCVRLP